MSLVEALKGQDAVVTAIAGEATADQTKIIDAAVEAGVKRFVPTEYGVDTSNPAAVEKVPFFKIKENMKKYLEEKAERGLIEWTSFITGAFFDWYVLDSISNAHHEPMLRHGNEIGASKSDSSASISPRPQQRLIQLTARLNCRPPISLSSVRRLPRPCHLLSHPRR